MSIATCTPRRRTWYHGSPARFEGFRVGGRGRTADFGTRLGIHLSARRWTAINFATRLYRGPGVPRGDGFLYTCTTDAGHPLRFGSEAGMGLWMRRRAIDAGLVEASFLVPQTGPLAGGDDDRALMLEYGALLWDRFSVGLEESGRGADVAAFLGGHLSELGHDCIVYGNTKQREVERYGEPTLIVPDPARLRIVAVAPVGLAVAYAFEPPPDPALWLVAPEPATAAATGR